MRENTGKVVLVGAGPGDTGLLTLKGEKYIKQADCLVYDRLSSPEFLSMTKAVRNRPRAPFLQRT